MLLRARLYHIPTSPTTSADVRQSRATVAPGCTCDRHSLLCTLKLALFPALYPISVFHAAHEAARCFVLFAISFNNALHVAERHLEDR